MTAALLTLAVLLVVMALMLVSMWRLEQQTRPQIALLRDNLAAARADEAALEAERDLLRQYLTASRLECERLTTYILELRREGFAPPPPAPTMPERAEKDLPPVVLEAMRTLAKEGDGLWYELAEEAERMLARDVDPETVAKTLRRGSPSNPLHW